MRGIEIYYGIDILRFAAAVMVMAYHLCYKAWSLDGHFIHERLNVPDGIWPWSQTTWFGWIGVEKFFVISGFVIAFSSEHSSPRKFVRGRIARLAPVMWVSATICLAISLYWGAFPVSEAILLYVKSVVFFPFGPWIAGQIWTLPIEIMFYLLILLLVATRAFRHLGWVCLALAGVSALYWLAVWSGVFVDTHGRLTQLFLLQHGCYFALGAGLWLMRAKGASNLHWAIILVALTPTWLQIETSLRWEKPGFGFEAWPLMPFAIWLLAIASMAASIFWNGLLSRRLAPGHSIIVMLGRMTYPLYLVHYHVGGAIMIAMHEAGMSGRLSILLAFAASLLVSYIITTFFERPISARLSAVLESKFERSASGA